MEVSSERTLEPVQLVLRLVGRDDLSGFYRQHPIEAGRAASAAAQAFIRHHPVSVRSTPGVNTLRAIEIESFFIRVGKLMVGRPRFASSEDVLEQDRSLLETLSLESIERPLPQDWEAFFSGLESSQKETLTDFFMALDAAFSARALDDGPGEGSSGEADRPDEILGTPAPVRAHRRPSRRNAWGPGGGRAPRGVSPDDLRMDALRYPGGLAAGDRAGAGYPRRADIGPWLGCARTRATQCDDRRATTGLGFPFPALALCRSGTAPHRAPSLRRAGPRSVGFGCGSGLRQ